MATNSNRLEALDALRGMAILAMVLSGTVPYGVLPAWMYHAQIPPPTHQFNPDLPGLTWVDLVFPLFLFALGAAIPLALSRRQAEGLSTPQIVRRIFERTFLLGVFAIYLRHIRPHVLNPNPTHSNWLIALLGFALLFPVFTRLPRHWPRWQKMTVRGIGWGGILILLSFLKYPDGTGFSCARSDIILIVLTNMACFGSLIWLITRKHLLVRLGILGILIGLRLAKQESGWVQTVWNFSPVPWIYQLYYLQYLFIVIPGTIVGDWLNEWQTGTSFGIHAQDRSLRSRLGVLAMFIPVVVILVLTGLQARWLWQTTLLVLILSGIGYWLLNNAPNEIEHPLKKLYFFGIYWLILGLIFEPYEGGIKKDHSTLSYYFVTTGLSILLLIALIIFIDLFKQKRWLQILIDNGQNPMIAYVGMANFIWPLLALSGLESHINNLTPTPWLGFIRGLIYTLLLAVLVSGLTRKKIFWRT